MDTVHSVLVISPTITPEFHKAMLELTGRSVMASTRGPVSKTLCGLDALARACPEHNWRSLRGHWSFTILSAGLEDLLTEVLLGPLNGLAASSFRIKNGPYWGLFFTGNAQAWANVVQACSASSNPNIRKWVVSVVAALTRAGYNEILDDAVDRQLGINYVEE